jgi:shikimate kinase
MSRDKIYIVGFMGSGKTTAGKNLSSLLGWTFVDLDRKVEEIAGMKIPRIFSDLGEDHFRKIESDALRELGEMKRVVISTGGGAPCHDNNMDFMIASGITIYLKLTPDQLRTRLASSTTERPLIKGLEKEDLLKFIEERLFLRENDYNRAEIVMEGYALDTRSLHKMISLLI